MKLRIKILVLFAFLLSCESEEIPPRVYSPKINFKISDWILTDKNISCFDFGKDGNIWMGSGSKLIFYDSGQIEEFDVGATILDIAVAPNGNIWIGTKDKGLAKFSGRTFSFYTMENSIIPRDYIPEVEISSLGKVWFSSAASNQGGLMNFDGQKFKLFTPENSILNQHVIDNLKTDDKNNIYFNTMGKVGMAAVFKSDGHGRLTRPGGDASAYWIKEMDVNSKGEIYVGVDYSLSSYSGHENYIGYYDLKDWKAMEVNFSSFGKLLVDKRDYVWSIGSVGSEFIIGFVFDGSTWHRSPEIQITETYINDIKVDENNSIWIATNKGIFVNQQ